MIAATRLTSPLDRLPVGLVRGARLVVLAVLIGIGINDVYWAVVQWPMGDLTIYLDAAARVREGHDLYVYGGPSYATFWYAPWFAFAWVPATFLPRALLSVAWSGVLLLATALVGWRLLRVQTAASVALSALVVGPLFAVSAGGNVQPLIVLALLSSMDRRSGPLWVGLAASLKITPILFVLVYVRRGQWARAAVALGLFGALFLPAFWFGFDPFRATSAGAGAPSLLGYSPTLYVVALVAAVGACVAVPERFRRLAASAAAVLALPRLFVYDVTLLAVGIPQGVAEAGRFSSSMTTTATSTNER